MKKTIMLTAVAAAITLSANVAQAEEAMGKCWGGAEKGKNDCGSKDKSHDCAGKAPKDYDPNEWKKMTKAECDKLKGTWEEIKTETTKTETTTKTMATNEKK